MDKKMVVAGETYRLKFFINGWEEGRSYFQSIGRFGDEDMQRLTSGEIIEKGDNTFSIRYEDEYGNRHTVDDVCTGNV